MSNIEANMTPASRATILCAAALALLALAGCGDDSAATNPGERPEAAQAEAGHDKKEAAHGEENHEEGAARHVKLSADQIKAAEIVLAAAGPAEIHETLPLYGVVAPNAERVLQVAARYPGVVRSVSKRVGDPVRRAETLATIESNESLQSYSLVSPLDGVVTARDANAGEQTGDKALFTVADLATVWVELSVFPRDVAKVRVGQSVRVKSSDTGLNGEGELIYVAPFGSSTNQTLKARVQLDNRERKWPPGLYVTAEVILAKTPVPLAIASDGLQTLAGRTVVFVTAAEGFEPRPVSLGRTDGELTEVLAGLESGETYATKNSFILKAELGKGAAAHED